MARLPRTHTCLFPRRACLLGCLTLLSACAVGTDYTPPKEELEAHWDALSAGEHDYEAETESEMKNLVLSSGVKMSADDTAPSEPWWEQFHDEILSELMEKALADGYSLKIARARIAEAQADRSAAGAELFPRVDASASISRATLDSISSRKPDTIHEEGITADWDIDPFGGNRRRREGAAAGEEAAEAEFAQARLDLLANVALNYCHLRAAQAQRELTLRNLKSQRDTLRITNALRKVHDVTDLDVTRVEAQIAATESRLPQIRSAIRSAMHRLSVLTGRKPSELNALLSPDGPMLDMPDSVAVLSPVATIAQRPDVHLAERRLAQSSALSNAAFADLFPRISLEGFFGARHSDFFGSLSPWRATASAAFPLLDFGRLRSQMRAADARQQQAFYNYKQTVLQALEDTENNLDAYMDERRRSGLLKKVASGQGRAVNIAREQYRGGIVTQLDLLDSERSLLDAESNWVLSLQTATDNLIQLYHALGMGAAEEAKEQ